jgi:fibronectin type 3 domain-containing protein
MTSRAVRRTVLSIASCTALAMSVAGAAAAAGTSADPTAATDAWLFDFGTKSSPVADGYARVSEATTYDSSVGYGLDRAIASRDRGAPDELRRDFVVGSDYGFAVDIPNGDYRVTVISGDQIASNTTAVSVEGGAVQNISVPAGSFAQVSISATVRDGQLNFAFGGSNARVNAIAIAQVAAPTDLHLAAERLRPAPSVSLAWEPVAGAAGYDVYRTADGHSDFTQIASTSDTSYVDEHADLGYTYTYAVTAVADAIVESAQAPPLTVNVYDESLPPPTTPTGLTLNASTQHDTFTLSWAKSQDARQYYLYRAAGDQGTFERIDTVAAQKYVLYIAPSTPCCYDFSFRVVAAGDGGRSAPSEAVRVMKAG